MAEHRMTITVTPITEAELDAFVESFRERFGRKHLVHVIGKQPAGTSLAEAEGAEITDRDEARRIAETAVAQRDAVVRHAARLREAGNNLATEVEARDTPYGPLARDVQRWREIARGEA